ncbi:type II toxin-antitoxin system antitoxin SocA domain-containing protein [Spiroplasma tabanidicola]|uniref:Antitoxin SocA-like Panacea domain-containing protein n=1 Tax=Spiroplasma tabanidicola TaxID=324079 RepID=A0A6I6CDQ5_9MOLU|nr:type II toxin-antitoxin system antitoxin SocA domain-containing protein [Spiroplasma tabanidicola]QGS52252.1 hypothetical protein STABA_v1c08970 [Spiroplasma tabanidicola]
MFFYSKLSFVNFILNLIAKINKKINSKITQIQIQKIIYIIYAYFLIFKKPIANISFETWRWGPVIYELWKQQTKYKDKNIPLEFDKNIDIEYLKFEKDYLVCKKIIHFMLNLNSWDIVQICHEQTPWKNLYKPNKNIKIKDEDIIKFHNQNQDNFFCYLDFIVNDKK